MNPTNKIIIRDVIIAVMMLLAAFTRLIPHPANVTAVLALALFGGAKFKNTSLAFLMPLVVMFITDLIIGFHSLMPFVYICVAATTCIGMYAGRKSNSAFIIGASVVSTTLFFLVTNAAVWYHNPAFTQSFSGLLMCYDVAIPFYRNQLFGDLFFNFVLFGTFNFAKNRISALAY